MNADGTNQHALTTEPGRDRHAAWSPDGKTIAFDSDRDGNFEIYAMNADGTAVRRLTHNKVIDSRPTYSPDGRWIMFQTEEADTNNRYLYVMRPDGAGLTQYSEGGQWATSPDWQAVSKPDACQTIGTIYADEITMFDRRDTICGLAGNDVIKGGGGDDVIDGGPGNDTIYGQGGNDRITGGPGADTISCGPGRDTVIADAQDHIAKDCEVIKRG